MLAVIYHIGHSAARGETESGDVDAVSDVVLATCGPGTQALLSDARIRDIIKHSLLYDKMTETRRDLAIYLDICPRP